MKISPMGQNSHLIVFILADLKGRTHKKNYISAFAQGSVGGLDWRHQRLCPCELQLLYKILCTTSLAPFLSASHLNYTIKE